MRSRIHNVPDLSHNLEHPATCSHWKPKRKTDSTTRSVLKTRILPLIPHPINKRFLKSPLKHRLETYLVENSSVRPYRSGKCHRREESSVGISPDQTLKIEEASKRRPLQAELHLILHHVMAPHEDHPRFSPLPPPNTVPRMHTSEVRCLGVLERKAVKHKPRCQTRMHRALTPLVLDSRKALSQACLKSQCHCDFLCLQVSAILWRSPSLSVQAYARVRMEEEVIYGKGERCTSPQSLG